MSADPATSTSIPPEKVGTITYTQRDVPARLGVAASAHANVDPTMGRVGGGSFPADPDDLGDAVPLPGGWRELFEFLAGVGFRQVEFAGYGQHPDNPGGTAEYGSTADDRRAYLDYARRLRGFLDEFGLRAIGSHGFVPETWPGAPGGMTAPDRLRFDTELEFASILGMPFMGTGSDPTDADDRTPAAWDLAGQKWDALNLLSLESSGIRLYPHNHAEAYHFLHDGDLVTITEDRLTGGPIAPTRVPSESGTRLMQRYLDVTSPDLCVVEMDIFWAHVARHRFRWRYDESGARVEDVFDPVAQVARQPDRYALFHAKDGCRTDDAPGAGTGYAFLPFGDPGSDIDFGPFFANRATPGRPNPNYEQDDAPGGDADPGRSLRLSRFSAHHMAGLRA